MNPIELRERFYRLYGDNPKFQQLVNSVRNYLLDPYAKWDTGTFYAMLAEICSMVGLPRPSGVKPPCRRDVLPLTYSPGRCRVKPLSSVIKYVPSIALPRTDVDAGNRVEALFVRGYEGLAWGVDFGDATIVEVTVVFRFELDPVYGSYNDLWRLVSWNRVEDLETFFIIVQEDGPREVVFPPLILKLKDRDAGRLVPPCGCWAERWEQVAHGYGRYEVGSVIYVNTWNHAMAPWDNNPGLSKVLFRPTSIPIREGSRVDAEMHVSSFMYDGEYVGFHVHGT